MSTAPPSPDPPLATRVQAAQAELVFERSAASNYVGPPVALLVAWLLWPQVDHLWLLLWVLLKVLICVGRAHTFRLYRRDRTDPLLVLRRHRVFVVFLAVDALAYGALGSWMQPAGDLILAVALVSTVIAAAAVGLVVLSPSLLPALAFTVPSLLPSIAWQLATGTTVSVYLGLGMCAFLLLLVMEARHSSAHTVDMLRTRFTMDRLAAQRQQALDEAQRSNAVKSRFLATMSHEMRTPLHGILGLAQLLREGGSAEQQEQRLQTLEQAGRHLLDVINDVLDFSRIEGGHLKLADGPLELKSLAADLLSLCQAAAAAKGLQLRGDCSLPAPCWMQGDAARLRQVLLNLLGNAVKFTPQGEVTLRCALLPGNRARLEVIDSGPGVPEADRERIFHAFEQIDDSDARSHGGTGLGLTIAREITEAMGGQLRCLAAPGGGALFRLELPVRPVAAPQKARAGSPAPAEAPRLSGRVLLAEDNVVNALVTSAQLERLGLQVQQVADGESAVAAALASPRPDLVLMDCQMPGTDGFEATRRIRQQEAAQRLARLPVVALTANALQGDRDRCLAAGMDDHLPKPFDPPELAQLLARHLPAAAPAEAFSATPR